MEVVQLVRGLLCNQIKGISLCLIYLIAFIARKRLRGSGVVF